MPVEGLRLAKEDEIRFRDEAVEVFHDRQALPRMLGDIGLPRRHWPPEELQPADAWQHALDALGNGAHPQGQAALLDQALRTFPRNPVFLELHRRNTTGIHIHVHDAEESGPRTTSPENTPPDGDSETTMRARQPRTDSGPAGRGNPPKSAPDFFVSYTGQDTAWAEWIAWVLEERGHRVLIQSWDFVGGTDWLNMTQDGLVRAERMIVVLSRAYLHSTYGTLEWQTMLRRDPLGADRRLLIARVEDSPHPGMLTRVRCDLFGKDEAEATRTLLDYVAGAGSGRLKPGTKPPFPAERTPPARPWFPGRPDHSGGPADG
jgi:hypothetical protein